MSSVLLDTDVLSFVAKADKRASLYSADLAGCQLTICFQTVAELRLWALLRRWGRARQTAMESLLRQMAVLPYDARMAGHWAEVTAHRRRAGRPIECGDAWIAAAALRHDVPLITNNAAHYAKIPHLKIITHAAEKPPP
jgi:predicted nucleic acid-binding protein